MKLMQILESCRKQSLIFTDSYGICFMPSMHYFLSSSKRSCNCNPLGEKSLESETQSELEYANMQCFYRREDSVCFVSL